MTRFRTIRALPPLSCSLLRMRSHTPIYNRLRLSTESHFEALTSRHLKTAFVLLFVNYSRRHRR